MRYNKSYYSRLHYQKWLQQDLLNSVSAYSVILTLSLSCGLGLYPSLLNLGRTLWPRGPMECGRSDTPWLLRLDQKTVMHFLPFALQGCSFGTQPSGPNWEGQTSPRGEINKGPLDMILANRVAEVSADGQRQHPDTCLQMIPAARCWVKPVLESPQLRPLTLRVTDQLPSWCLVWILSPQSPSVITVVLYHYILQAMVTVTVHIRTNSAVKNFICFLFFSPGPGGRVVGTKEAKRQKSQQDRWQEGEREEHRNWIKMFEDIFTFF